MLYLYMLVAAIGFFSYLTNKFSSFIICFYALTTDFFGLKLPDASVHGSDLALMLVFLLLIKELLQKQYTIFDNNNPITRFVLLFICFYIVEFIITILTGADTFSWSLKVTRKIFILFSFFLLKEIPNDEYNKSLRILLYITVTGSVLFLLQYLGVFLLRGGEVGMVEFINIPEFLFFFTLYTYASPYITKNKWLYITLFFVVLFASLVRGWVFGFFVALVFYLFKKGDTKQIRIAILLSVVMIPAVSYVSSTKEASLGSVSAVDDIKYIVSNAGNLNNLDIKSGGTMTFRIAMLTERVNYLIDNPQYAPLGVGAIHEDSPNCYKRFDFSIGTHNPDRYFERCMIESGDIVWAPIVIRYGLFGVLLHLLFYYFFYSGAKNERSTIMILAPLFIWLFVASFDGEFFNPKKLADFSLYFALLYRCKYKGLLI